jgi:hypothetical protein
MTLFLLFFACIIPPQEDLTTATSPAGKTKAEPTAEVIDHKPIGKIACAEMERVTWKGDVWLTGGDEPTLAYIEEVADGKKVACALAWPFRHPKFAEFSFCEKRSGRGECITVHPELETLDE